MQEMCNVAGNISGPPKTPPPPPPPTHPAVNKNF